MKVQLVQCFFKVAGKVKCFIRIVGMGNVF
jgi:hypothetical protein